jgi:hypothetical protein
MTNVADPRAPDLAARVLDVRSETGMLSQHKSAVASASEVRVISNRYGAYNEVQD